MLVLVVDTSTPAVTAALVRVPADGASRVSARDGVELVAERVIVDARAHGELLAPGIVAVLGEGGARPADLGAIVAGLGPGPFTGLRVGLVTAASLGQALAIPTYGVCSLDGIGALTEGVALVATDARRKEVYWAVYDEGVRISGPAVNRPADLAALLDGIAATTGATVRAAAGDGARMYAEVLGLPVAARPTYPSAVALAGSAADRILAGSADGILAGPGSALAPAGEVLRPLYLRRPDAVEPGSAKLVRQ